MATQPITQPDAYILLAHTLIGGGGNPFPDGLYTAEQWRRAAQAYLDTAGDDDELVEMYDTSDEFEDFGEWRKASDAREFIPFDDYQAGRAS